MIHYIVGLPYKIWAFLAFKYKFKKPYVLLDIRRAPSQMYQRPQIFVKRAPKAHTTTLCVVCVQRPAFESLADVMVWGIPYVHKSQNNRKGVQHCIL